MAESVVSFFSEVIEKNRDKFRDDKDLLVLFVFWYLDGRSFVLLIDDQQYPLLDRFKNENNPDPITCLHKNNGKKMNVVFASNSKEVIVYFETFGESPGRSRKIPLELKLYIDDEKKDVKERMEIMKKLKAAVDDIAGENKNKNKNK